MRGHRSEAEAVIGSAAVELEAYVATTTACAVLDRSRATHHRRRRPAPDPEAVTERRRAVQPRALSPGERVEVLEVLHIARFVDESPATVWATLLRQAHGTVIERRRQATHPPRSRPELAAEAPNDIWSWDITRLRGPGSRNFFYLYVLLDLFSRYVPGWMLASVENAQLARRLIDETVHRHDIDPTGLTIHSDRGETTNRKTPVRASGLTGVVSVEAGEQHSVARKTDGPYGDGERTTTVSSVTAPLPTG